MCALAGNYKVGWHCRRFCRLWLFVLSLVVLQGCSNNDHKVEPAPLQKINSKVEIEKIWSHRVGSGVGGKFISLVPDIEDKTILAADAEGLLVAFDLETGDRLWKLKTGEPISGAVEADNDLVFLGTLNGELIAIDASDQSESWRVQFSSEIAAPPTANSRIVAVQTVDGHVFGLERQTGKRLWVFDTTVPVLSLRGTNQPYLVSGAVLAGFGNGRLVVIDSSTGLPIWDKQIATPGGRSELDKLVDIDGRVIVSDKTVYAATYQGRIVAIDLYSGRVLWQRDMSTHVDLAEDLGVLYVADSHGTLWALDTANGATRWQQPALTARQLSSPAVVSDFVVVGDYEGFLHCIDKSNGQFVGRKKIDSDGLRVQPLVENDTLYVLGNGGVLAALQFNVKK